MGLFAGQAGRTVARSNEVGFEIHLHAAHDTLEDFVKPTEAEPGLALTSGT